MPKTRTEYGHKETTKPAFQYKPKKATNCAEYR